MKVEVLTPDQYMGDVTGDLNRRRGMLEGMDTRAGVQVIKAKVPLSEMFGYVTQLRSMSSGRASSTMEFSHYAPAPNNIAEEVIAKSKPCNRLAIEFVYHLSSIPFFIRPVEAYEKHQWVLNLGSL